VGGLLVLALTLAAASPALPPPAQTAAEPERLALIVGNNVGAVGRRPLRYAEDDAGKLARVLVELGGFRAEDVALLAGRPLDEAVAALERSKRKIARWRQAGRRVVLLFYFSGHADGDGLEIGRQLWSFSALRAGLAAAGAELRLTVIDSCFSGAVLGGKAGSPGPNFEIRFTSEPSTAGEVVLTSTSANEVALESPEIGGSFFSHHLISGLRGAADSSGDGQVTLDEVYHYAFASTLRATAATLPGPQHPSYDYRLAGQGDLVLTRLPMRGAGLWLPEGFDRILIARGSQVLAEVTSLSARRIALPPGRYSLVGWRREEHHEGAVVVVAGQERMVAAGELRLVPVVPPPPEYLRARASAGLVHGAATAVPWLPALRLGLQPATPSGWLAEVELARAVADGVRESVARGTAGLFVGGAVGRWTLQAGWRVSLARLNQSLEDGSGGGAWVWGFGPCITAAVALGGRLSLIAAASVDAVLVENDRRDPDIELWPAGTIGMAVDL
jgi:hypothetical protein